MKGDAKKKQLKSTSGKRATSPSQRAHREAHGFWDWFLDANHISKRDFVEELEVDQNPEHALQRLFIKMNNSAKLRRSRRKSGKGGVSQ